MRARRSILCDALHRKLHALITAGDVEGTDACWKSCNSGATLATQIGSGNCRGHSSRVSQARLSRSCSGWSGQSTTSKHLATEARLRKELVSMYEANGWAHLAENEKMGLVVRFP